MLRIMRDCFAGINANPYVYFVHSYYLKADNDDIVAASTEYSTHIRASVEKGNLFCVSVPPRKRVVKQA